MLANLRLHFWLLAYDLTAWLFGWGSPINLWVLGKVSDATDWSGGE